MSNTETEECKPDSSWQHFCIKWGCTESQQPGLSFFMFCWRSEVILWLWVQKSLIPAAETCQGSIAQQCPNAWMLLLVRFKSILNQKLEDNTVAHTYNSSNWEEEARRLLWAQRYPRLHSQILAILGCSVRPCLKKHKQKSKTRYWSKSWYNYGVM